MEEVDGSSFMRVRGALASLSRSTSLTVRWGEYEVRMDGINRARPARWSYGIQGELDPMPEGVFLVENTRNCALLDSVWETEPRIPPRPVRGFWTVWSGGIPVPWLTRALSARVSRFLGVGIDPGSRVWVSRWVVVGHHYGEPVRALAGPDNKPVGIPPSAVAEDVGVSTDIGVWHVPEEAVDPRIPEWNGAFGPLQRGWEVAESEGEGVTPTPTVGVVLPLPWAPWGAVVRMTRGGRFLWLPEGGDPVRAELPDLWPAEEWVIAIQL